MKNLKGGYQLIDLEKNDLSSSFTLEGLYNTITLSNNKSLLVTGIVISGTKKNDVYTTVEKSGDDYTFTIYGKTLTISDEDTVTISSESLGTTLYKHTLKVRYDYTDADHYKYVEIVCINDNDTPITDAYDINNKIMFVMGARAITYQAGTLLPGTAINTYFVDKSYILVPSRYVFNEKRCYVEPGNYPGATNKLTFYGKPTIADNAISTTSDSSTNVLKFEDDITKL